jgi:hypothetical protein
MRGWNFSCQFVLSEGQQSCSFRPDDGVFSTIYITIAQGVPLHLTFELETGAMQVGDLVLLWGKPDMISSYYICWHERNGVTPSALVQSPDRLDYFAPVQVVSFAF